MNPIHRSRLLSRMGSMTLSHFLINPKDEVTGNRSSPFPESDSPKEQPMKNPFASSTSFPTLQRKGLAMSGEDFEVKTPATRRSAGRCVVFLLVALPMSAFGGDLGRRGGGVIILLTAMESMFWIMSMRDAEVREMGWKHQCVLEQRKITICHVYALCEQTSKTLAPNANVASEDRTHDLRIMRPTRYQLHYCHLDFENEIGFISCTRPWPDKGV